MPVYSFRCSECGSVFDRKLTFDEVDGTIICPNGHASTRRIFVAPAVLFKGSGFYVTDHREPSKSNQ